MKCKICEDCLNSSVCEYLKEGEKPKSRKIPEYVDAVIDGKHYDTRTATLLAGPDAIDNWIDKHSMYLTSKGNYFLVVYPEYGDIKYRISPMDKHQAKEKLKHWYPSKEMYKTAFPEEKIEEA